jgi:hypothetical protein
MAYEYQLVSVRPGLNVEFFQPSQTVKDYIQTTYKNTGKFSDSVVLDDNDLIQIKNITFTDFATWQEFAADPIITDMVTERSLYNLQNGITLEKIAT